MLRSVLEVAQVRGFIGDGDLTPHLDHALGFAKAISPQSPSHALDLGSGGGLPGLVLATHWVKSHWVLLDSSEQRTNFLEEAVDRLGLRERVVVVRCRAEEAARQEDLRSKFDLVVARSFGGPAVVAECAAGFLAAGGLLVVSEPPGSTGERWNHSDELRLLGLTRSPERPEHTGFEVLVSIEACAERYPRRVGIPTKRPLF